MCEQFYSKMYIIVINFYLFATSSYQHVNRSFKRKRDYTKRSDESMDRANSRTRTTKKREKQQSIQCYHKIMSIPEHT